MSDIAETAKAEALKKAWARWFEWDYSWEGLAEKEAEGFDSLQAYWRIDPETQRLRSDTELRAAGELIEVEGQKTYHLAHLPLHYPNGSPTRKTTDRNEARSRLDALIRACLSATAPMGAWPAALAGAVVLDLDLSRGALATPIFADWSFGIFAGTVDFSGATFTGDAGFEGATFTGDAWFEGATFTGYTMFWEATFTRTARFWKATFTGDADFSVEVFGGAAEFELVQFKSAYFNGRFAATANFRGAVMGGPFHFRAAQDVPEAGFFQAFRGARFSDIADFTGAGTRLIGAFDHAIFEKTLILDQVAEGKADDEFTHTILAETLKGDPKTLDHRLAALEGGCRTVKVAMGKARDEVREQRYYRYQLLARRARRSTPWPERLVSWLYWLTSNYGSGFWRQPSWLLGVIVVFALSFVCLDRQGLEAAFVPRHLPGDNFAAAFYLSVLNVLRPLAVWSDLPKVSTDAAATSPDKINAWIKAFFDLQPLWFRLLCSLESFLAIVLLFLFVLAVRRKFQIS